MRDETRTETRLQRRWMIFPAAQDNGRDRALVDDAQAGQSALVCVSDCVSWLWLRWVFEARLVHGGVSLRIECAEEAAAIHFMAGGADLANAEQDRITVAIDASLDQLLGMTAGISFAPEAFAAAAVIGHAAGFQGGVPSFFVHPRQHQDRAVFGILGDGRQQTGMATREIGKRIIVGHDLGVLGFGLVRMRRECGLSGGWGSGVANRMMRTTCFASGGIGEQGG